MPDLRLFHWQIEIGSQILLLAPEGVQIQGLGYPFALKERAWSLHIQLPTHACELTEHCRRNGLSSTTSLVELGKTALRLLGKTR